MIIQPTIRCNIRCKYCYYMKYLKPSGDSDLAALKRFVQGSKDKEVLITGGEPTLYKDLIPLCEFLIEKKKKVCIGTNGVAVVGGLPTKVDMELSIDFPRNRHNKNRCNSFDKAFQSMYTYKLMGHKVSIRSSGSTKKVRDAISTNLGLPIYAQPLYNLKMVRGTLWEADTEITLCENNVFMCCEDYQNKIGTIFEEFSVVKKRFDLNKKTICSKCKSRRISECLLGKSLRKP